MRIDAYNSISQIYKTNSPKKTNKTSSASQVDMFEMSSVGKEYQIAKQAVASASDIRVDRVNDIKSRMEAGNYNVSDDDFASMLVSKFLGE